MTMRLSELAFILKQSYLLFIDFQCNFVFRQVFPSFISLFNQLDAQNLFHNKFYCMPQHVSSTCTYHQEVKIVLHSLWYHHTYRCDDTRCCLMQFLPPDDEHMCSKHVEACNKTYCEKILCINFV